MCGLLDKGWSPEYNSKYHMIKWINMGNFRI